MVCEGAQSEIGEDGQVASKPLSTSWSAVAQAGGRTCITLSDNDNHDGGDTRCVAVPVRSGGVLLGALMVTLDSEEDLDGKARDALEGLAGLAGYVLGVEARSVEGDGGAFSAPATNSPQSSLPDDILWQMDADFRFTHVSSISGIPADWLVGRRWEDVIKPSGDDETAFHAHRETLLSQRPYQDFVYETQIMGKTARVVTSGYPVFDTDGAFEGYRGVAREVSPQVSAIGAKTTRFDPVTGLLNRSGWYHALRRVLPGDQPYTAQMGLILIDIDHFKAFNQRLGHAAADEVLKAVARRLEETIRVHDRLARIGSDEFSIIAGDISEPRDVSDLADRLGEAFLLPLETPVGDVDVSITIGMALAPDDGRMADDLISSAGLALARAKAECRGQARFYSKDMRQQMRNRVILDNDLQKAVAAHEFELFYQPQLRLSDNKVIGAEALLRWRHPERGILTPYHFLDALEQSDYALSVGNWVVKEGARKAKAWFDEGFPVRVGVNMSTAHFRSADIVDLVAETIAETQLDPGLLELEVTENVVLQSGEDGRCLIAKLRELGVNVSFDDFGTGYGSLSDLRSIPVDRIKIDRSFITDSLSSANDASIVRAIISLAKSLGLQTIAEGVEDVSQEALLRLFGCDEVQGYLYSRPIPAAAFDKLLRDDAQQRAEDAREAVRLTN